MMICFLNGPFIVMFSLGLGLSSSLMIFWIFSIFLFCRLGKFSLIFNTSLVISGDKEEEAWAYDFFVSFAMLFFLKYLEISLTFFGDLARIGGEKFEIEASLLTSLPFLLLSLLLI